MSQSFCFLNTDTCEVSQVPFPFDVSDSDEVWTSQNPECETSTARNLHQAPIRQWETFFDYARSANNWANESLILAVGEYTNLLYDYGSIGHPEEPNVRFASGHDEYSDYAWVWDSEE